MVIIINNLLGNFIEKKVLPNVEKLTIYTTDSRETAIEGYSNYKPFSDSMITSTTDEDGVYSTPWRQAYQTNIVIDSARHMFTLDELEDCTYAICSVPDAELIIKQLNDMGKNYYQVVNFINASLFVKNHSKEIDYDFHMDHINGSDITNNLIDKNLYDSDKIDFMTDQAVSIMLRKYDSLSCHKRIVVDKTINWMYDLSKLIIRDLRIQNSILKSQFINTQFTDNSCHTE